MKFLNNLILIIILPKLLFSNVVNIDDVNLLKLNDKNIFLKKCYEKKEFKNTPKCLNFLGIKIFLNAYYNNELLENEFIKLYKKSIYYLEISANKGSKEASRNLGWLYSNGKFNLHNFEKSSLYFKKSIKKEVVKVIKADKKEIGLKNIENNNFSDVLLAISLINKVKIYFEYSKNNKYKYITNNEYEKINKNFNAFLNSKKVSFNKFSELEKIVLEDNKLIFTFLKEDLKNFNKENLANYNKVLVQLKKIINN